MINVQKLTNWITILSKSFSNRCMVLFFSVILYKQIFKEYNVSCSSIASKFIITIRVKQKCLSNEILNNGAGGKRAEILKNAKSCYWISW